MHMLFIKKLFKLEKSSRQGGPASNNPQPPGNGDAGGNPLTCDNQTSKWAKKRIPGSLKDLPQENIEIEP